MRLHERQPKQHPATAATRPHARLRLRAYPVLPTPDYTPPVLPAQVRSQRAPRKSPCWPALLALAARVCSTAGSCQPSHMSARRRPWCGSPLMAKRPSVRAFADAFVMEVTHAGPFASLPISLRHATVCSSTLRSAVRSCAEVTAAWYPSPVSARLGEKQLMRRS